MSVIGRCAHDFYHLPEYHAVAESFGEGTGMLFHYTEGEYSIALPLLMRSLAEVRGLRSMPERRDVTSVYGYAGPVASHQSVPEEVVRNFQNALRAQLMEMGTVSVFARLHPMLEQAKLLDGLGTCTVLSKTVSIDLTLTLEAQRANYRSSLKTALNKTRKKGVQFVYDADCFYLEPFIDIYYETMRRVDAVSAYFFPREYFRKMKRELGDRMHLGICMFEGEPVCGAIFIEAGEIMQYHLGGTLNRALAFTPMKMVLDEMRIFATNRAASLQARIFESHTRFRGVALDCGSRVVPASGRSAVEVGGRARPGGIRYGLFSDLPEAGDRNGAGRPSSCGRSGDPRMNVMLTGAARRNFLVGFFQSALGSRGKLIVCEANASSPALAAADEGIIVPEMDDPAYIDALLRVCVERNVRLIISLNDLDTHVLAKNASRFRAVGAIVLTPDEDLVATCSDKWAAFEWLRKSGIATPETRLTFDDVKTALANGEMRFPIVVKPRWGTSSLGVEIADNLRELELAYEWGKFQLQRTVLRKMTRSDADHSFVFQQRIQGDEIGIDVVNDLDGNYAATFARRKLAMRDGNTDRAVSMVDPKLDAIGRTISGLLKHPGSVDADLILCGGDPFVIDINPRLGGGYPFSHMAGANLPAALMAWAEGNQPDSAWLRCQPGIQSSKFEGIAAAGASPRQNQTAKNILRRENISSPLEN
jgi:carbamoyl-phosphate synthase large subunit